MGKSQREYVERTIARVDRDRECSVDLNVEALLADLQSEDESVRLRALRAACTCHTSWDVSFRSARLLSGCAEIRANASGGRRGTWSATRKGCSRWKVSPTGVVSAMTNSASGRSGATKATGESSGRPP